MTQREIWCSKIPITGPRSKSRFASLNVDNLKIALIHGDKPELLIALTKSQAYDLVVYGHTHTVNQAGEDKTLVLNPGEICGYLSGKATMATFETTTRRIEIFEI